MKRKRATTQARKYCDVCHYPLPPDGDCFKYHSAMLRRWLLHIRTDDELPAIEGVVPRTMTLEEIGKVIGVTRERARQIEHDAMCKLYTRLYTLLFDQMGPAF